MYKKYSCL